MKKTSRIIIKVIGLLLASVGVALYLIKDTSEEMEVEQILGISHENTFTFILLGGLIYCLSFLFTNKEKVNK